MLTVVLVLESCDLNRVEIISKKESGVIYGWQLEPNNPPEYGRELPHDIQISRYSTCTFLILYLIELQCTTVHIHVYMLCKCEYTFVPTCSYQMKCKQPLFLSVVVLIFSYYTTELF